MLRQVSLLVLTALWLIPACDKQDSKTEEAMAAEPAKSAPVAAAEATPEPEPAGPTQLVTDNFVAPIPPGYTALAPERVAELAKQVGQSVDAVLTKPKAQADHFTTSIVFTRVESDEVEPETVCAEVAALMAAAVGVPGKAPKTVEYGFGKTCQFEMGDGKQQALQTLAYLGNQYWTVTCNFDPRDEASPKECVELLSGFAAK